MDVPESLSFTDAETNWDQIFTCYSFDELNLQEQLLRGVYAYGYERPSAIQQRAIVPMIGVPRAWPLLGRDDLGPAFPGGSWGTDAVLHWNPLVHRKAQRAVVMTVLLIGERLRRCCDREWVEVDGDDGGVVDDGAGAGGVVSAAASLTLDPNNANVNSKSNPLAGLKDTLPNEMWLEILGMAREKTTA